jgi:DNA-binding IclR family transcriptional regulator
MAEPPRLDDALRRLRAAFRETAGTELSVNDLAELAGLEAEECRILLQVLLEMGAIQQRGNRVFVFHRSSWWDSVPVQRKPKFNDR